MSSILNTQILVEIVASFLDTLLAWIQQYTTISIGIILTVLGGILAYSELRMYLKNRTTYDQLVLWVMVFVGGLATTIANDIVFGLLLGITVLMIVETYQLRDTPVWGKLMMATTASYMFILGGKIVQMIHNYLYTDTDQFLSLGFNFAFYVFIAVAFYYFGRKFILVSRFSSPNMVYLFIFSALYIVIAAIFPRNKNFYSFNYLGIDSAIRFRVLFADFGTYEVLILVMIFMYLISGWLLRVLFGVKPVEDEELLRKVHEIAETMGIKENIQVGYVKAPILNAFAYGPWFDKRIAFISNDLSEFKDSDIRGIVGHELAHAAKNHTLWLLVLSIAELAFKKGIGLPATQLDYTFLPEYAVTNVSFAWYYVISYGLVVILLIFVRILEGHADLVTKKAGYGDDLAQALYRLEGFYNGVAADFGISVNLLTDRTYSLQEKRRFNALAARSLYGEVTSPGRGAAFANIFQSHPRTSYRIASLVDDNVNPLGGAFLPYRILGLWFRKSAIQKLADTREEFHKVIDETYLEDYGEEALDEVIEHNPLIEAFNDLVDKHIIAYNKFTKDVKIGKLNAIKSSTRASSPIIGEVDGQQLDLVVTQIKEYYPKQKYLLKNGEIATLIDYYVHDKKGLMVKLEKSKGDEIQEFDIKLAELGKPISFLENLKGKEIVLYQEGFSQLARLEDLQLNGNLETAELQVNGEKRLGNEFIFSFPPLGFEFVKEKVDEQKSLLEFLKGKKILLYTKENFDISLSGRITELLESKIIFEDADGKHEIEYKHIEYIALSMPTIELIAKKDITLFTKFGVWWANRKEFNYIVP